MRIVGSERNDEWEPEQGTAWESHPTGESRMGCFGGDESTEGAGYKGVGGFDSGEEIVRES